MEEFRNSIGKFISIPLFGHPVPLLLKAFLSMLFNLIGTRYIEQNDTDSKERSMD